MYVCASDLFMKAYKVMLIVFKWGFLTVFFYFSKIPVFKDFFFTVKKHDTQLYFFHIIEFILTIIKLASVKVMHFIITLIFFLNIFLNAVHITVEKLQRKFCTSVKNEICFSKSNLDFIKFQ